MATVALVWDAYAHYRFSTAIVLAVWLLSNWKRVLSLVSLFDKSSQNTNKNDQLLTQIHNKWFDLSSFNHPGGPVALSLARGRDATALFESHHPFMSRPMLMKILSKYEIPKDQEVKMGCKLMDERDDGSPYDWKDIDKDGFASELRVLVHDYFSNIAKKNGVSSNQASKATPARWLIVWSFLGLFFASLPSFVQGSWVFLVVTPILAWLAVVNYWHDSLHFALSSRWRINAWLPYLLPLLSSPWMWYHHHVIGHHAYTNIGHKDPDLAHAPQLMREHESIKWRPHHLNQASFSNIFFIWSIAAGLGLNLLNDIRATIKLTYNNVVPYEKASSLGTAIHVLGRLISIYVTIVWPFFAFSLWKAFIWAAVPNAIFSICFMINTQINHLCGPCAHASSSNFYKHQVVTAQNFGNGSLFCYYFSGGLNYQIEHHLFPTINHCHLPALSEGVKRICKKHDVPYNHVSGYKEALAEHYSHTIKMATKPQT